MIAWAIVAGTLLACTSTAGLIDPSLRLVWRSLTRAFVAAPLALVIMAVVFAAV